MTTALTVVRNELTDTTWGMIEKVAPTLFKSRLFGVANEIQAAAIMLKGHELGMSMTASFEFISVIQDKPTLSPRGALALVMQSPVFAGMKVEDQRDNHGNPTSCKVWMKRKNGAEYETTFTLEDARRGGLIKPGSGWEKFPANMLRWRGIGYVIDMLFSDVTGGMKRADEFGANITPEGDVITVDVTPSVVEQARKIVVEQPKPVQPQVTTASILSELVTKFGASEILAANGGKLPSTVEECHDLKIKMLAEEERIEWEQQKQQERKGAQ